MAGNTVASELRGADARAAGVEFAVATRADEAELRALLRATPTPGAVSLRFEREPDYFAGENVGGARDTTIVARRGGRVVCMGRCSRREVYVGGRRCEAGYLGELRLAPDTPNGLAVLRAGYAFFARIEAENPAEFYFTSMAQSNVRARAVLESGRVGLPKYEPLADLITVAWPVPMRGVPRNEELADAEELAVYLDAQAKRHALTMTWDATRWAELKRHGLGVEDFCVVRRDGRIVAAAGVWDQSEWRQTVVAGYGGATGRMRPLINGLARLAGRPGLPPAGGRLRQACVHPLAVSAEATADVGAELLTALERRARAKGVEWLVASVGADDALRGLLGRRAGAREYATRLSAVRLHGRESEPTDLRGQIVRPEAGLL
jgi:hypothetical protein